MHLFSLIKVITSSSCSYPSTVQYYITLGIVHSRRLLCLWSRIYRLLLLVWYPHAADSWHIYTKCIHSVPTKTISFRQLDINHIILYLLLPAAGILARDKITKIIYSRPTVVNLLVFSSAGRMQENICTLCTLV